MLKIAVILSDIRSAYNVGSILRSCDCFGVSEVIFAGITPYPKIRGDSRLPHMIQKQSMAIHKTALGAENTLNLCAFADTNQAINYAKQLGFCIASLEQSSDSVSLTGYSPCKKLAIILGNEVTGLSRQTQEASDVIIELPMFGKKESLNVSVIAAIALYSLRLKI
ncbi:MAG: TrmH family RNA methyltransferase [Candidatus Saccharibacteria bacterium]